MISRKIEKELQHFLSDQKKKALLITGARQVGKTWILEEFGKSFPDGFVRFNFDKEPEYAQFFSSTKDVRRILQNLSMASGQQITKDTLIIFDEIHSCLSQIQ